MMSLFSMLNLRPKVSHLVLFWFSFFPPSLCSSLFVRLFLFVQWRDLTIAIKQSRKGLHSSWSRTAKYGSIEPCTKSSNFRQLFRAFKIFSAFGDSHFLTVGRLMKLARVKKHIGVQHFLSCSRSQMTIHVTYPSVSSVIQCFSTRLHNLL